MTQSLMTIMRCKVSKNNTIVSKSLTVRELKAIISLCSNRGVSELKYGSLSLRFGDVVQNKTTARCSSVVAQNRIDEDTTDQNEFEVREEQLANLLVDNPAAYEKLLAQNELEDAKL